MARLVAASRRNNISLVVSGFEIVDDGASGTGIPVRLQRHYRTVEVDRFSRKIVSDVARQPFEETIATEEVAGWFDTPPPE